MLRIENVLLSTRSALSNFCSVVNKNKAPLVNGKKQLSKDEVEISDTDTRTSEERTKTAVLKLNEANEDRIIAETNRSAINYGSDIDNFYDQLLPNYSAYKNPELKDYVFTPVSNDTVTATYKKKFVDIKFKTLEDGNTQHEIKFKDGSQINYITYTKDGKKEINGEEFDMPAGTIVEIKSVKGRVFSQLIQLPDMQRKVIDKPEYLDKAEQLLEAYKQQ